MSTNVIPEKRWEIDPKAPQEHFNQFPDIPPLVTQILYNRGFHRAEEIHTFVSNDFQPGDPYQLQGMSKAVATIVETIQAEKTIAIYGDYDADGVTSSTLITQALRALGAKVRLYIPDRFGEGYGLNKEAIVHLAQQDISLVLTVDCGIRSVAEVAYGNQLGLKFIITDHHQLPQDETGQDIIPPAVAVINPKQQVCTYSFDDFAGVGLAFKLVQALKKAFSIGEDEPGLREADLLDLVALGTVADMVPLIGENRMLVKRGLTYINQPQRAGLGTLMSHSGSKPGQVTAGTIGFILGPRLNAAGRLTHAQTACDLLLTDDVFEAGQLAMKLGQLNVERQTMTQRYVDQARHQILAQDRVDAPLHLVLASDFNQGVVGLVASRITEEFYRPSLVAQQGEDFTKGSGRSIPEFNITQALDECADLLLKYGGHAAAAGFTIENTNLPAFRDRLTQIATAAFCGKILQKTLSIDGEVNLRGVTYTLVRAIENLQPFGYGNPTPKFVSRNLKVVHCGLVGKDRSHLKLKLSDGKNKQPWDSIGFRMGQWADHLRPNDLVDVVYALELNTWQGYTKIQLNLKDIRRKN